MLFAKRFDSYIEGFALRAAISDFVAADLIVADAWAVAETRDAELAKEARTLFETFMQAPRRAAAQQRRGGVSYGWTEADAARDAFVGSYGRVFDHHRVRAPGLVSGRLQHGGGGGRVVRERPPDPDRAADGAAPSSATTS